MKRNKAKTLRNKLKKQWKEQVRKNWSNTCAKCGISGCKLDTHHLAYHKELKWIEPMIGVLLCSKCHKFGLSSAHKGGLLFYQWFFSAYPELVKEISDKIDKIEENKI